MLTKSGPRPALRPPPVQLPSQTHRNELFELYFEQIVHLSYPMVVRPPYPLRVLSRITTDRLYRTVIEC